MMMEKKNRTEGAPCIFMAINLTNSSYFVARLLYWANVKRRGWRNANVDPSLEEPAPVGERQAE